MLRVFLPLPFGERVGVRGRSCLTASFFSRHPGAGRDPVTLRWVVAWSVVGFYQRSRNLAAYAAGVPASCRRPGHFLLLAQEKVTKEKGPPDEAPSGRSPEGTRTGYGVCRQGILP